MVIIEHQSDDMAEDDKGVLQPVVDSADLDVFNQSGIRLTQGGYAD